MMKILLAALLIVGVASAAVDPTSIAGILANLNASLKQELLQVQTNYKSDVENVMRIAKKALAALAGDTVNGIKSTSKAFLKGYQQLTLHVQSNLHAVRVQLKDASQKIDELMEKKYPQKPKKN